MRRSLLALAALAALTLPALWAQRVDAGAFAPPRSSWTLVVKSANETRTSNNTITADSALTWTAEANAEYWVRLYVDYANVDVARDLQYTITGPSSPTRVNLKRHYIGGANTAEKIAHHVAYPSAVSFGDGGAHNAFWLEGVIHNGANAGTVSFDWAQDASDGDGTIVLAGSYWQYRRADQ